MPFSNRFLKCGRCIQQGEYIFSAYLSINVNIAELYKAPPCCSRSLGPSPPRSRAAPDRSQWTCPHGAGTAPTRPRGCGTAAELQTEINVFHDLQIDIMTLDTRYTLRGLLVTMPEPRGRKSLPTKFSRTLLLPALCPPTTAIWGRSSPMLTPVEANTSCIELSTTLREVLQSWKWLLVFSQLRIY